MKKSMFKWVIVLAMFGLANGAFAQSKITDQQKEEMLAKLESYRAELNLTEEQQEQVKTINSTYFEGLAVLKASDGSRLAKLKQFRALSGDRDDGMERVLDKEQYKRYMAMQQEMRSELKSRRKS